MQPPMWCASPVKRPQIRMMWISMARDGFPVMQSRSCPAFPSRQPFTAPHDLRPQLQESSPAPRATKCNIYTWFDEPEHVAHVQPNCHGFVIKELQAAFLLLKLLLAAPPCCLMLVAVPRVLLPHARHTSVEPVISSPPSTRTAVPASAPSLLLAADRGTVCLGRSWAPRCRLGSSWGECVIVDESET